ncbi:ComF family protein [Candidatus Uhrbacteria bacterium]|nr:ComF family protein [Candidatus Uhrbacteria bacterium]
MKSGGIRRFFISALDGVVDLIFPPQCTGCGREGAWVCVSCARSLVFHSNARCPECAAPFWRGFFCPRCTHDSALLQCVAAFQYADARVARMVHSLKYDFVTKSAPALGSFMAQVWSGLGSASCALCVPIPLHPSRERERGFNQAELLAREFSSRAGIVCVSDVLVRIRPTSPQTERSRQDRRVNMSGAFSCIKPESVRGFDIVLIDDVYTTGATLQEAARALKHGGAGDIYALTFAHG